MDAYRSPWMNEELDIFREAVRRFAETELLPHEERWKELHHTDRDACLKAGEMGLLLTDIPK